MAGFALHGIWSDFLTAPGLFLVLGTLFWTWMLLGAIREPEPVDRIVWVVVLVGAPIMGSLICFFVRYLGRSPDLPAAVKRSLLSLRAAGRPLSTPESSSQAE